MTDILRKLKEGKSVEVPIYDFQSHSRQKETKRVYGASVVIFEGIMTFHNKEIRDLMDMKGKNFRKIRKIRSRKFSVFVDTESDIRLARRLMRDISQRGRHLADVLNQYNRFVKPAYEQHIAPTLVFTS